MKFPGKLTAISVRLVMIIGLLFVVPSVAAMEPPDPPDDTINIEYDGGITFLIPSDSLRTFGFHNSGLLEMAIGTFMNSHVVGMVNDPETGEFTDRLYYPTGSTYQYLWAGSCMVGGIVNGDTLVSTSGNMFASSAREVFPSNPEIGGFIRTGHYADDEFEAVFTDTVTDPAYVPASSLYDPLGHRPLGLKITQRSYSWSDTLYDDFVILSYQLENIGTNFIEQLYVGYPFDPDIYDQGSTAIGYLDDFAGALDTALYDDDPLSKRLICYASDDDGDPSAKFWDEGSIRGIFSIRLLGCDLEMADITENFNWFITGSGASHDFGPRQIPGDGSPVRYFAGDVLGTPNSDADKYFIMSYPEVDFVQLEAAVHDSADGWLPLDTSAISADTKFIYSFGGFDMAPGDTFNFAVAIVVGDNFHAGPNDYSDFYDIHSPDDYMDKLNFSELLLRHRRADSVYQSGYTLPEPGPPAGLKITGFDDSYIDLAWHPSRHPSITGYHVYVSDSIIDDSWHQILNEPTIDTQLTVSVLSPDRTYLYAVTGVSASGEETSLSYSVAGIPGMPHAPINMQAVAIDGLPEITWEPGNDTALVAYFIYRAEWSGVFSLYDSTASLHYTDHDVINGRGYRYRVTAVNDYDLESDFVESDIVIPFLPEKDILFYDMNYNNTTSGDPYRKENVDRIREMLSANLEIDYYDIQEGRLNLEQLADYRTVIFHTEKNGGKLANETVDTLRYYLELGGRGCFVIPNLSSYNPVMLTHRKYVYGPGSFFYDILQMDSVVVNGVMLYDGALHGDLMGCMSQTESYPDLVADTNKLTMGIIPVENYIPYSGYLFPRETVDTLYTYNSFYPDSTFHNQVNGVRYTSDSLNFVILGFPLSLMKTETSVIALRKALDDLGINAFCGDVNRDDRINIVDVGALINYLYNGAVLPDPGVADVDCSGAVDMGDAIQLLNLIFEKDVQIRCCQD